MTLYAPMGGRRQKHAQRAIGTGYTTLVPAQETIWTLESLLASNITALSANFTLEIYDGSNATVLIPTTAVAANTPYQLINHHVPLEVGEILRVKSGTASAFDVTAVGIQANSR